MDYLGLSLHSSGNHHRNHVLPALHAVQTRPLFLRCSHLFDILGVTIKVVERKAVETDHRLHSRESCDCCRGASGKLPTRFCLAACNSALLGPWARKPANTSRVDFQRGIGLAWFFFVCSPIWKGPGLRQRSENNCKRCRRKPRFFAHLLHQPRNEAAAAQRIIADQQAERKSGSPRLSAGKPISTVRLCSGVQQCAVRLPPLEGFGQERFQFGRHRTFGRQSRNVSCSRQCFGLCPRHDRRQSSPLRRCATCNDLRWKATRSVRLAKPIHRFSGVAWRP